MTPRLSPASVLLVAALGGLDAAERHLYSLDALPIGTTASASFPTEDGKGIERLIDGDADSAYAPKQGTARAGKPASLFLRFAKPQADVAGIVLGRGDQFGNYIWQKMEFHADTDGDGTYETIAGRAAGSSPGRKVFDRPLKKVYGLELRVTQQKVGGAGRCFILNEVEGLVRAETWSGAAMRTVVEDFEDFTTWRTWGERTGQPKGERYYGGYVFLTGSRQPDQARNGQGVGVLRFNFAGDKGPFRQWSTRGALIPQEGVIEGIAFAADHRGHGGRISFEIIDGNGRKFRSPHTVLSGEGWQTYEIDCGAAFAEAEPPCFIKHLFYDRDQAGQGDIHLDDLTIVGIVDRRQRLDIQPVYQGIAYDPAAKVVPRYRLRNALGEAQSGTLKVRLFRSTDPDHRSAVVERSVPFQIAGFASTEISVDLGRLPYDHYEAVLGCETEVATLEATDPIAVFTPNGGRVNGSPMWFGSQHHGHWVSAIENDWRFDEFVVPLGMDCYRTGPPDRRVIERGILVAAGFGGVPPHLRKPGDKDDRGEPNHYAAYAEWCREQAREHYLPYADRILSVEFYNEPDLPDFCYLPDIDVYMKMHRIFSEAFREVIPGIAIGTGSVTVGHAKEKKDFTPRMFTELTDAYDVAVWHAHGTLSNYISRHRQVEAYLRQAGVPEENWRLGNSEAASVSWHDAKGRLDQAVSLIQKMGWAKAQRSSLFYTWFTTGDVIDPQDSPRRRENWGLFDDQQRCKPSGQAFNEIVRQLANTEGLGEVDWGSQIQVCAYRTTDGTEQVYLVWPRDGATEVVLPLACTAPVTLVSCFGQRRTEQPVDGRLALRLPAQPTYLRLPAGKAIAPLQATPWIQVPATVAAVPQGSPRLAIRADAAADRSATLAIQAFDADGGSLAETALAVTAGASSEAVLVLPAGLAPASSILVAIRGPGIDDLRAVSIAEAVTVPRVSGDAFPARAAVIPLRVKEAVRDLVYDPATPLWAGADDLSAEARLAHDGEALLVEVRVRDQDHRPGQAGKGLWNGDSLQFALAGEGTQLEVGLAAQGEGTSWVWMDRDPERSGRPLDLPFVAVREGAVTRYRLRIPFSRIGSRGTPGTAVRCTWLINEDDGRGRVRLLSWYDGIATSKDPQRYGTLILE